MHNRNQILRLYPLDTPYHTQHHFSESGFQLQYPLLLDRFLVTDYIRHMFTRRDTFLIIITTSLSVIFTILIGLIFNRVFEKTSLTRKQLVDEQLRCNNTATSTYYVAPEESFGTVYYTQFAFFNPDLYKCFYFYHRGKVAKEFAVSNYGIIDVYDNSLIAEYTCDVSHPCTKANGGEFYLKFKNLFPGREITL